MMIQDGIPIQTLERAVSTDVVTAEELLARQMMEILRARGREATMGGLPSQKAYESISEGLFLQHAGGLLLLTWGILGQNVSPSPPDVPAPGSFDSDYRCGYQLITQTLTDPWDATNAWWLLQARVVRTATLVENRDVYNPALGTFAVGGPFDKRYESQVETAWKKGTATTIAAADAGYTALGAVYRPAGGGAITNDDIVQLSLQMSDLVPMKSDQHVTQATKKKFRSNSGFPDFVRFSLAGEVDGVRLYAHTDGPGIIIRSATFIDPAHIGSINQAGYWWYVYLAKAPDDRVPSNLYGVDIDHRGVLIASRVMPDDTGANSAQLSVPDPIGGTVATGDAVHVGYFQTWGPSTWLHEISIEANGDGIVDQIEFEQGAGGFPMTQANQYQIGGHNLAVTGFGGTEDVPYGCTLKCFFESVVLDVTAVGLAANVVWNTNANTERSLGSFRNLHNAIFELQFTENVMIVTLSTDVIDTNMAPITWNAANVALNEHRAGMCGLSF